MRGAESHQDFFFNLSYWLNIVLFSEIEITERGTGQEFSFGHLTLTCPTDIQVEMSNKQLYMSLEFKRDVGANGIHLKVIDTQMLMGLGEIPLSKEGNERRLQLWEPRKQRRSQQKALRSSRLNPESVVC